MQKISAGAFDLMITAGIAAISITVLYNYLVPILIITTVGGVFTMVYTVFIAVITSYSIHYTKLYDKRR